MNILGYKEMMNEAKAWESEPKNIPVSNQLLIELDEAITQLQSQLAEAERARDEALAEAEAFKGAMLESLDCARKHKERDLAKRLSLLLGWSSDGSEALATLKRQEQINTLQFLLDSKTFTVTVDKNNRPVIFAKDVKKIIKRIESGEVEL